MIASDSQRRVPSRAICVDHRLAGEANAAHIQRRSHGLRRARQRRGGQRSKTRAPPGAAAISGEGGIRTLVGPNDPNRFSRPAHSTALPPLRWGRPKGSRRRAEKRTTVCMTRHSRLRLGAVAHHAQPGILVRHTPPEHDESGVSCTLTREVSGYRRRGAKNARSRSEQSSASSPLST